MDYFPWTENDDDDALAWVMEAPDGFEKRYQLDEGISVKGWFPADATFQLSDERGVRLSDSIPNVLDMLLLSERFKTFLENESGAKLESFPIRLRNKKGRIEKASYFLV